MKYNVVVDTIFQCRIYRLIKIIVLRLHYVYCISFVYELVITIITITLTYGHTWKNKCVNLNWRFTRFLWRRLPLPTNSEYVKTWEGKLKIECECCWCVHLGCCMHVRSILCIVFNILIKTHENTTLYEKHNFRKL